MEPWNRGSRSALLRLAVGKRRRAHTRARADDLIAERVVMRAAIFRPVHAVVIVTFPSSTSFFGICLCRCRRIKVDILLERRLQCHLELKL